MILKPFKTRSFIVSKDIDRPAFDVVIVSKWRVDVPTADFVRPSICPFRKKNNLSFAHKSVVTIGIDDAIFFLPDPCLMCRVSQKDHKTSGEIT